MEAGETPEEGITREVGEETSLTVESLSLIGVYEFLRMNQVIIAYHVAARGEIVLSPELVDYRTVRAGRRSSAGRPAPAARSPTGCARAASSRTGWSCRRASGRPKWTWTEEETTMEAQKEIDTRGMNCPLPILKAKKALADMSSGDVLKVVATDPGSVRDFQAFARQTGNELLEQTSANDEFVHYLRRR